MLGHSHLCSSDDLSSSVQSLQPRKGVLPITQNGLYIDKTSPVQLWYQLRNAMLSQIVSGAWKAGDQVPTEKQLCDTLSISRATVRAALQSLVRDGLVVRQAGKGSFVAATPTTQIKVTPLGFYRTMTARGYSVRSKVLGVSVLPATKDAIGDLNLHEGDEILCIHRLRYLNDRPAALSKNYLAYNLCCGMEDEDLSNGSLWAKLEHRLGRRVAGGIHTFYAVPATEDERRLLKLAPDIPLLMSIGTNYLEDGTPFELSEAKMPGDGGFLVARYVTRLASSPEAEFLPRNLGE